MDKASFNVVAQSKRAFVLTLLVLWGSEILQGLGIIEGVFDWYDFVAFLLGASVAYLIDKLVR